MEAANIPVGTRRCVVVDVVEVLKYVIVAVVVDMVMVAIRNTAAADERSNHMGVLLRGEVGRGGRGRGRR